MPCSSHRTTETIQSVTGSGTIPGGLWSYSVYNAGAAVGTLGGVTIPIGVTVTFEAYHDYTIRRLSGMTYDATGTTFIITTTP